MNKFVQRCCGIIVKYSFVFFLVFSNLSLATMNQPYGVRRDGSTICHTDNQIYMPSNTAFVKYTCALTTGLTYMPHSGLWKFRLYITEDPNPLVSAHVDYLDSGYANFDANISLNRPQVPNFPALDVRPASSDVIGINAYVCFVVVDEAGNMYKLADTGGTTGCSVFPPLPPHPPTPSTCSIENGKVIDVDLGTMERSEIPTVQGGESESVIHKTISIDCEATNDVSVNMQISYTPITISATDVVKSSVPGLGVAVVYNNKALSPSDKTAVTLKPGSNSLDLAFQAIRDPDVELAKITPGEFTASAVLVMTEQ